MPEIIPAIIPKNFKELEEKLSQITGSARFAQIDMMDGSMTPEKSWPYISATQKNEFEKLKSEDSGLPFWQDIDFEVDLMIKEPALPAEEWFLAGATRIILHIESSIDFEKFLNDRLISSTYDFKTEIGLAIGLETPNAKLVPFISRVDFVQFMGIRNIGFQGESFDREVLDKISDLRKSHPQTIISVDGGVNLNNAKELVSVGVDRLVSGSAIFGNLNPREAVDNFKSLF